MVQSEQSGSHNLLPLGKENTIIAFHGKKQLVEQTFSLPSETLPASRPRQAEIIDRFYLWCDQVDPRGVNKDFEKTLTYARNQKEFVAALRTGPHL